MTKEELKQEAEEYADGIYHYKINVSDYGEDGIINYRYSDVKEAYLASAEPREKRITELTEHNETLMLQIQSLGKENAELKEQLGDKVMQKQKDKADLVWKLKTANEQKADLLTKAKELIKYLLSFIQKENYKTRWDINIAEAEQFISEVEK